jgi:hypothetical protein
MSEKTGGKRGRGQGALRKDGQPRESNVGTTKPVVDDSNWRVKAVRRGRIKFDDQAKERYLQELARTGRRWAAEDAAGVARSTVDEHKKNDPDFGAACEEAAEAYATRGIMKIETEALDGQEVQRFDPETGTLVQTEVKFETRLREMFLKRHDPGYRDKSSLELTGKVGVVVVPAVSSMADWRKLVEDHERNNAKALDPDAAGSAPPAVH